MHFVCTDYALLEIEYAFDMVMIDTRKGYGMHRKGMRQGQRRHKGEQKKPAEAGYKIYFSKIYLTAFSAFAAADIINLLSFFKTDSHDCI